jgi:hypothetical protein
MPTSMFIVFVALAALALTGILIGGFHDQGKPKARKKNKITKVRVEIDREREDWDEEN